MNPSKSADSNQNFTNAEEPPQGLIFTIQDDNTYSVSGEESTLSSELVIPSTYKGLPVTYIEIGAFFNCKQLTSVVIPNSITRIGFKAFDSCSELTDITIPGSVTKIEELTFLGCRSLQHITIPHGVTFIDVQAFEGCTGLVSVKIPVSVTSIICTAFKDCPSAMKFIYEGTVAQWRAITGPDLAYHRNISFFSSYENVSRGLCYHSLERYACAVTGIGSCTDSEIVIPNVCTHFIRRDVRRIESFAFCSCKELSYVYVPNSVNSIGDSAFHDCTSLKGVTLFNSITSIESSAFRNCTVLTEITFKGTIEQWEAIDKEKDWHARSSLSVIRCTDGEVTV